MCYLHNLLKIREIRAIRGSQNPFQIYAGELTLERKMANHGKHRIHGKRMGYGICGTHLPGVGDPTPNSLTFRVFRVFRGFHFRIQANQLTGNRARESGLPGCLPVIVRAVNFARSVHLRSRRVVLSPPMSSEITGQETRATGLAGISWPRSPARASRNRSPATSGVSAHWMSSVCGSSPARSADREMPPQQPRPSVSLRPGP